MTDVDRLAQDLGFVRRAVSGSGPRSPVAVYFLWAAIVFAGFALTDLRPLWVGFYWLIAGPLGGATSGVLAHRDQQRRGEVDRGVGLKWGLHWGAFMGTILLLTLMPARGAIQWDALAPIILLFVALTYFYAGLHLDRPLLWIGLLAAAGYLVVLTVHAYPWTIVGVMMASACAVAGLRERRARAVA